MIYSHNLFTGFLTPVNTILFTVPSQYVCVVRDIEGVTTVGPNNNISINCKVAGTGATIWLTPGLEAYQWAQWKGRVVLNAGDVIEGNSAFAGTQVIISGYLLTA